ncbi:DUF1801 domain-containing protein [Hyphobacterium sp. CCMP332]|nr:DUF1801 domain-containing protein [Hyphobacterium sp. CCMP332]
MNEKPKLLSGGNPQIPKGDGDQPVQDYIAAMPDWKSKIGHYLDQLIEKVVPKVKKAVRWNTPFYGIEGKGWFIAYNCTNKYVSVTFFKGTELKPIPPIASKVDYVRYFRIYENDNLDEQQLKKWIKLASELPGEKVF